MQEGLYIIAGEAFDQDEVIAGRRLFKRIKKRLRKLKNVARQGLKLAGPALGVASFAMPALAPAAAAASMATRLARSAKRGKKPARAAMRMMASSADRGDDEAARFLAILQRLNAAPTTLLNAAQIRELAKRARQGNLKAKRTLQYVAGLADAGDPSAQALLEQAAGTTRWDLVAGHSANRDLEILESGCALPQLAAAPTGAADIVAGGSLWTYFKPRRGYRDVWSPRDAYRLGIEAARPR